ncbi:heterokaryon incompatibility protein-domain-containing protein [Corynascus similis CBS 632.67]
MADAFEVEEDSIISLTQPDSAYKTTVEVSFLADLDEDDVILSVFVPPGVDSPHPHIRTRTPVSHHSGSAESLELARRWLDGCVQNHKDCEVPPDTPMPTRVLDIGDEDRDPVLVETKGRVGRYATLSYCWGKKPQLKTTKESLSAFLKAIPVDELQQTALDAIKICRHLGMPYLWIDALCIVQDDEDDWLRESSRMCEIYSSSTLTIAAAWSINATQGIFVHQQYGGPGHSQVFSFGDTEVHARRVPLDEHVGNPLAVNTGRQYTSRVAEKSWVLRPRQVPLARRAWTVQERVLSRRVLYYTPQELWWECDSCWACECEEGESFDPVDDANIGSFGWLRNPKRSKSLTPDQAYKKWAVIVFLYSAGNLTILSDKLPALSGIAQQFQRALQTRFGIADDYLAGMWRRDLAQQLLWLIGPYVGRPRLAPYPVECGIPTWSWASVNGIINHAWDEQEDGLDPLFTIRDVSTNLATSDPFGKISGGKLVLESRVTHGHTLRGVPRPGDTLAGLTLQPSGSLLEFYADRPDQLDPAGCYTCLAAAGGGNAGADWFMVLTPSQKMDGSYERVGLGAVSRLLGDAKDNMWKDAQIETVTIV